MLKKHFYSNLNFRKLETGLYRKKYTFCYDNSRSFAPNMQSYLDNYSMRFIFYIFFLLGRYKFFPSNEINEI